MNRAQAINSAKRGWYVDVPRGADHTRAQGLAAALRILEAAREAGRVTVCHARPVRPWATQGEAFAARREKNRHWMKAMQDRNIERCTAALAAAEAGLTVRQICLATGMSWTAVWSMSRAARADGRWRVIGRRRVEGCNRYAPVWAVGDGRPGVAERAGAETAAPASQRARAGAISAGVSR